MGGEKLLFGISSGDIVLRLTFTTYRWQTPCLLMYLVVFSVISKLLGKTAHRHQIV